MKDLKFSDAGMKKFEWLLTRYPQKQAVLLPTLRIAEQEFGELGLPEMKYVAGLLGISPARVFGVVTFYTHYRRAGTGCHHIQVCSTLSCALRGAQDLVEHIEEKLGIECGETTEDGLFSLSKVECLGSCDTAPMFQMNDDYYENLTHAEVDKIIERCRAEARSSAGKAGIRR
jgi:NADH-quinone oxidoreductase subunit E